MRGKIVQCQLLQVVESSDANRVNGRSKCVESWGYCDVCSPFFHRDERKFGKGSKNRSKDLVFRIWSDNEFIEGGP